MEAAGLLEGTLQQLVLLPVLVEAVALALVVLDRVVLFWVVECRPFLFNTKKISAKKSLSILKLTSKSGNPATKKMGNRIGKSQRHVLLQHRVRHFNYADEAHYKEVRKLLNLRHDTSCLAGLYATTPDLFLSRMNDFLARLFKSRPGLPTLILYDLLVDAESSELLLDKVKFLVGFGANIHHREGSCSTRVRGAKIPLVAEYFERLDERASKARKARKERKLSLNTRGAPETK